MLNRPLSPPRRPFTRYSTAVKRLVPYQRDVLGYTPTQIATSLNMSLRVVYRVLRLYDEEGVVAQQLPRGGRPRSLEDAHVAVGSRYFSVELILTGHPKVPQVNTAAVSITLS
ncbi:hypothetical protein DL93DRAFT_801817 [Clavulina sp. PMI_390]|nr:hypothetical protein DL93DRAFT_801817 [Clavulina sp. PMI_390]